MLKLKLQQFGAPGLTSPIRSEAFDSLQLNAGIFLVDLDYSSIADANALKTAIAAAVTAGTSILGVTRGGGNFNVTRETRTPDVDGMRYPFKGADFVDSVDAYLSGTLLEVNPDNFKRLLGSGDAETSGKKTTITMRTAINPNTDYINSLCWIGDLADGRLVLIELDNAFNTADFSLNFTDKGEGTMAFEFHARQDDVLDYDNAPFRVVFFEPDGTNESITVTSSAGTNVGGTALSTTNVLGSGQHYVYKIGDASNAPSIGYREEADYTWTEWDGLSEIAVGTDANGKKATLAVVNASGKAVKSGSCTLAVKTA